MSVSRMIILIFAMAVLLPKSSAQTVTKPAGQEAWVYHILQSDAKKLLGFMAPMVDVELPTQRGAFNHSQLQTVLAGFFRQYPPSAITISQQGALNPRNDFFIGTYTSSETEYRLYIQAEKQPSGHKIFSFSIQRK